MFGRRSQMAAKPSVAVPFTVAVLPDTQQELWNQTTIHDNFDGRLTWLAANKQSLNLKYMVHVGDVHDTDNLIFSSDPLVNPRYIPGWPIDHYQYYWASEAFNIIENAGIPYILANGNHDSGAVCGGPACPIVPGQTQETWIEVRNTSTWNMFYPPSRFPGMVTYETNKSENSYRTFESGGLKWLVLVLELWPRTEIVNWAKTVLVSHLDHNVIISTHSYLDSSGTISTSNGGYGANSPRYVFDNLLKIYPNVRFVFCGHVGTSAYRVDTGNNGNKIYSMLNCYHDTTNNFIRLLDIDVADNSLETKVYSPRTNYYRTGSADAFTITGIDWVR